MSGKLQFEPMASSVLIHHGKYSDCYGVLQHNDWLPMHGDISFREFKCSRCGEIFDESEYKQYEKVEITWDGLRK